MQRFLPGLMVLVWPNRCRFLALAAIGLLGISTAASAQATRDPDLEGQVKALCQSYLADLASAKTHLAYGRRINGPQGTAVLVPPAEVRQGLVRGKPVPYGYGSGIEDLALHNGHLLFALCDAYEATKNAYFAETARHVFSGLKLLGSTSPVPGFVPRGPHPDDLKSYYADSSLDQHTTFVYALWRYYRSEMLQANVWEAWRRADWAPGDISGSVEVADEEAEKRLGTIGLSLKQSATVFDLWDFYRKLAPQDRASYWVQRLCVRMPMGSLHAALLSGQRDAVGQAVPRVRQILKELDFKTVDSGETYYLAAVLGLHLVALEASEATATWQYVPVRTTKQKANGYTGGEMGQMAFTLAVCPCDPNWLAIGIDTAGSMFPAMAASRGN